MEQTNTNLQVAQACTYILNPYIVPSIGFWILLNVIPGMELYNNRLKYLLLSFVLIASCVLPIAFKLVLDHGEKRNPQRPNLLNRSILPYLLSAISMYICAQFFGKLPILGIFKVFLFGYSLILILQFIIGSFWNISGHATSIAAITGVFLGLSIRYGLGLYCILIFAILCAGGIGTSQLLLGKHTEDQVYAGYLLGFVSMFSLIMLI